ncbi:MAG: LamG-like jellyroll fold domain-containing protein [Flavobacteriales bacterium]
MKTFTSLLFTILLANITLAQDTTLLQTLTFDSTSRAYTFTFPDGAQDYRQILMRYRMRCKNALVSSGSNTNLGCGEWDYSCNTFITDSASTDSVKATHPNYTVSGFSGSSFPYTTQPTYTYFSFNQLETTYTDTTSETIATIGSGALPSASPFTEEDSKVQYLISASDLVNGGLTAGEITGLNVDVTGLGSDLENLRIKLKGTTELTLNPDQPNLDGFSTVYFLNSTFSSTGLHQFNFSNNFSWNGTDNLIVEFSHSGSTAASTVNGSASSNNAIASVSNDYSLGMGGSSYVSIPSITGPAGDFSIEWNVYPNSLVQWNQSMQASTDWGGFRFHVSPAGSAYVGTDVSTRMTPTDIPDGTIELNKWQHFAFTYENGTGRFYKNGVLIATKTGMTAPGNWNGFILGATGSNNSIDGKLDEVRIWNTAVSGTDLTAYLHKSVDASHPSYSDLMAYYKLDDETGSTVTDETGMHNGTIVGSFVWRKKNGTERNMNFTTVAEIPNLGVIQGVYTSSTVTTETLDSLVNTANLVTEYAINGTDLEEVATYQYYQSGGMPIFDETGTQSGTVSILPENTLDISDLEYFQKYPAKIEIMSFVTPYGIGLDLGDEGKMWEFDMTDFTTVLRGDKRLSVEFAGAYQEELDIQFLFIHGTPPRDVLGLQHIWKPGVHRSYSNLLNDRYFEPRTLTLHPQATAFKLRSTITGHGQEGEFIPRNHFLNINGGSPEVEWQVWTECADNPIYPQGGTWVYDRAGWCPGAASDLLEYEIDPDDITGSTMEIDYGISSGSGTSNYYVSNQIVSYGAPNFTTDAAVISVERPTDKTEQMRFNPNCNYPIITIQNTGSANLNSLKINYQVKGGYTMSFNWTGALDFLESQQIELPIYDIGFWYGDGSNQFEVTISEPNGSTDENADNNFYKSHYELSDSYEENFVVQLKTNNNGFENSYEIRDMEGNVVFERSNLANNTYYRDTLNLPNGCYTLELTDTGEDGLQWWANSSQGNGHIRLRRQSGPGTLKNFDSDFGKILYYTFNIGETLSISETELNPVTVKLYPNPSNGIVFVSVDGVTGDELSIRVMDVLGKQVFEKHANVAGNSQFNQSIDLSNLVSGSYLIELTTQNKRLVERLVKN